MTNATPSATIQEPVLKAGRTGKTRIAELDGLRGIAVLMVVLFHFIAPFGETSNPVANIVYKVFRIGWAGVDLFFVLSGFLIGGILLDAKESRGYFKTFYLRRVYRIFPIYYLWIGIYFLLSAALSVHVAHQMGIVRGGWVYSPVFALYLQNTWKTNATMESPWLSQLWSLAVEEQFYLVIPFLVRFLSRRRLVLLLIATMFLAPLTRLVILFYFPAHWGATYRMTVCRADALAAGVLLAVVWRDTRCISWILDHRNALYAAFVSLFLGVLYVAVFLSHPEDPSQYRALAIWDYSCVDLFFANLLLWTMLAPKGLWAGFCRWRFLTGLGAISYCMYIIHLAVNVLCHAVVVKSGWGISTWPGLLATIAAGVLTWCIGKISWRFFERPLIRRGHVFRYEPAITVDYSKLAGVVE
ncbi:MAG: acyltransferase family protein [Candidatus Acidiferrales bacterium]